MDAIDQTLPQVERLCAQLNDETSHSRKAFSIVDHYASIFSWLQLLDFNMMVILVLMLCVSGFTMVSGLFILILERTQTIGVLKAMGATNTKNPQCLFAFCWIYHRSRLAHWRRSGDWSLVDSAEIRLDSSRSCQLLCRNCASRDQSLGNSLGKCRYFSAYHTCFGAP